MNARESLGDKIREAEDIMQALGTWKGADPATGFQLVERADGRVLKVADLVDDDGARRDRVIASLKDPAQPTTATMSTSSSRSAWPRRASTGSGASMR